MDWVPSCPKAAQGMFGRNQLTHVETFVGSVFFRRKKGSLHPLVSEGGVGSPLALHSEGSHAKRSFRLLFLFPETAPEIIHSRVIRCSLAGSQGSLAAPFRICGFKKEQQVAHKVQELISEPVFLEHALPVRFHCRISENSLQNNLQKVHVKST